MDPPPPQYEYNVSVIAIFKNETMNLKMWLEHYLWQGVDHFFLIDNGSTDDPHKILQPYIDRGIVTYRSFPERFQQSAHYRRIFDEERVRDRSLWVCVCDLDEFFYGAHRPLRDTLRDMDAESNEEINVIYSSWKMFGHEHLREHPPDIRTAIVHRNPELEHQHTKYIFKTRIVTDSSMLWIHCLRVSTRDCTENERIQLNHYPIQSLQFYQQVKMTRGAADDAQHEHVRDMNYFHHRVGPCVLLDDQLRQLVLQGYPSPSLQGYTSYSS